jgi:two-component system, repressor protein LuxO
LAEVMAGRFREDLFYRLHVVPIHVPPLRERRDDAVLIARTLLARYAAEEGKRFLGFSEDAEAAIRAHDWPGNVRQLQNVLRNAVVMSDGEALTAAMLNIPGSRVRAAAGAGPPVGRAGAAPLAAPAAVAAPERDQAAVVAPTDPGAWAKEQDIVPLWRVEKAAIERAIDLCAGNVPRAAAFLDVSPSTLYRKRQAWEAGDEA